ncbi:MAG: tRNA (guanosine(37)-N1)-methyltransferase TrmD [Planctomycetaceae bacterium]|nr:tRNA (guanosine(37)-N1)-methyltransferase TrmD [Planctomycetaceae bacterium]
MRIDVFSLFPELFSGFLGESILKRALDRQLLDVRLHNPRQWTENKHGRVDDRPYGGGPGMVLSPQPIVDAVEAIRGQLEQPGPVLLLSPAGKTWNQPWAEELATEPHLMMLCGRYEGFDQRILDILQPIEVSIGDYVINGGEVAAMVLIETMMRLLPGALGDEQSALQDSFSSENRILEFPQYTRPRDYRGLSVPEVLLSGDHPKIEAWRRQQSETRTRQRRRELLDE